MGHKKEALRGLCTVSVLLNLSGVGLSALAELSCQAELRVLSGCRAAVRLSR